MWIELNFDKKQKPQISSWRGRVNIVSDIYCLHVANQHINPKGPLGPKINSSKRKKSSFHQNVFQLMCEKKLFLPFTTFRGGGSGPRL